MSLTPKHLLFIELDRKKALFKQFFEDYRNSIEELVKQNGVGHTFQDSEGIVYQLSELDGKWVNFEKHTVNRTKRPGEDRGSLSVKAAQELGYKL